jgi:phosphate starvation-inducible protein PhoH and related proteins
MAKRTVTGTTKQAARTATEKKIKREKPPRLTEQEKMEKYGKKNFFLNYKINFKPLTQTQEDYFDMILSKRITFGTGVAGSGKSFVCLAAALKLLREDNTYKKILILTPTVEAGNMNIGFLKGSKEEKIQPYLEADFQTMNDILEMSGNPADEIMKGLIENKLVSGDCVSFMRGKTIKNTIVIITEAENFDKQEMMLLLSRISPTSKYIINGDNRQQDRKDIKKGQLNGLKHAMDTLKGKVSQIGFCHFLRKDIVRDPLIEEIMDAWFEGEEQTDEY